MKEKRINNLQGGILVTNPIPEEYSMDPKIIDAAISTALMDAQRDRIKGKETTPYLLKKIVEITGGDSLESNIRLVLNNAIVGARIAKAYSEIK